MSGKHMDKKRLGDLLRAIGENPDEETLDRLFTVADESGDGIIELEASVVLSRMRLVDIGVTINLDRYVEIRNSYAVRILSWVVHQHQSF